MITQEYDYLSDLTPSLDITLRPQVKVRPYQESCIQRVFVEGRAKSGIIILPCGAGKTLVGILSICQIQKRTLILCINNLTVKQWQKQITHFTYLDPSKIILFTSETAKNFNTDLLDQPCILITTYTMLSRKDELKSQQSLKVMQKISSLEWSLLLLDEVQVAPAEVFKTAFLIKTKSHCKIGLTATLIREDNKIEDLQFYIGPKLYEENWIDLTNMGYLSKVQCVEIQVSMDKNYMKEYNRNIKESGQKRFMLYSANPKKFEVLEYLIGAHKAKGDKIIVFIDLVEILIEYAQRLEAPYISGEVSEYERDKIITFFKHLDDWNVLFVSRVGDVGIDLPDANVAIELCSLFGSRRQEAQRLGRIL